MGFHFFFGRDLGSGAACALAVNSCGLSTSGLFAMTIDLLGSTATMNGPLRYLTGCCGCICSKAKAWVATVASSKAVTMVFLQFFPVWLAHQFKLINSLICIPPLSSFAPRAGLVPLRQTFARCCDLWLGFTEACAESANQNMTAAVRRVPLLISELPSRLREHHAS